ncbi:hypothetical protein ACEN2I_16705 [Flavobacterium sp. W22_SRS_FK3]
MNFEIAIAIEFYITIWFYGAFPAIRYNILCQTLAQNDFHFYQGSEQSFS